MRTVSVVVLAACLVACSSPAEPVARDDASTPLDARALEDLGADGGAQMDAGDVDAGRDAGAVVLVDAGPRDSGPRDAGTVPVDAPWTSCTVVPQSGCDAGLACRYQYSGGVRTGRACEPAGTDRDGWLCERRDGGGDTCLPGLWCSVTCRRSCLVDADCPPDVSGRARRCDLPGGTAGPLCVVVL